MRRHVRLLALGASRVWRESADFVGHSVNAVGAGQNSIGGRGRPRLAFCAACQEAAGELDYGVASGGYANG